MISAQNGCALPVVCAGDPCRYEEHATPTGVQSKALLALNRSDDFSLRDDCPEHTRRLPLTGVTGASIKKQWPSGQKREHGVAARALKPEARSGEAGNRSLCHHQGFRRSFPQAKTPELSLQSDGLDGYDDRPRFYFFLREFQILWTFRWRTADV